MDVPATAPPASSSSQIDTGDCTEALITPGPTTEKVPAVSETTPRCDTRRDEGKDPASVLPLVSSSSGPLLVERPPEEKTAKGEGEPQGEDTGEDGDFLGKMMKVMMKVMAAKYRASKDTPERLEKHRARMSLFNGMRSSDGPDRDPEFNPLYTIWESWASTVQYIHDDDLGLLATSESLYAHRMRELTIFLYSFAVPSRQVLEYMVKRAPDGRIVEVGAGSGYWANLLQKLGADVVAVDNGREVFDRSYFPACKKQDGAEFLASGEADGRALFLCWPRMKSQDSAAATFLENYSGDTIFYVGEENGATFCMFDWLEEHEEEGWVLEETLPIPTWPGLHDKFMCFSKVAAAAGHGSGLSADSD